jgi:hypothetical protein
MLDIVDLLHLFTAIRDGISDKIDRRSRYSRRCESRHVTSDNFFITKE